MCFIRREYKINTHKSINNNFINLWYSIASQFKFIKLTFEQKYTTEEIDNIIKNYNLVDFVNYNIIWENEFNTVIILINKIYDFGKIFVVEDSYNTNRYFIGFCYNGTNNFEYITGLFIYFKNDGTSDSLNTIISLNILGYYNKINNQINSNNSSLYNQTLLFVQVNPESQGIILTINYLNYYDEIIYQSFNHLTNYQVNLSIFNTLKHNSYSRFFYFEDINRYSCFIDLGSLKLIPKTNLLQIFTYTTKELNEFIKLSSKFEIEYYGDGYPINCIRCNMKTSICNIKQTINLGRSYCFSCLIRYSTTNNCWYCCKLNKNYHLCNSEIQINECTNEHVNYNFTYHIVNSFNKYPGRDEIIIQ